MNNTQMLEIISLVVTIICVVSFSVVFTILFRHYFVRQIEEIKYGQQDLGVIENAIYERKQKKDKKSKTLSILGRIGSYTLLGLVGLMFVTSLVSRLSGNTMLLGNQTYVVIATGSMSTKNNVNSYLFSGAADTLDQQFQAYDVINIKKYESQEDVKLYDVIAFKAKTGKTIVHRIIKINDNGTYITRGDANKVDDTGSQYDIALSYENVIGRYTGNRIRGIGIAVIFLQSNSGIITVVSVLYCIAMYDHYRLKYLKTIDERTDYLIKILEFDLDNSTIEEFQAKYLEIIKYKDKDYKFNEEGKFFEKDEDYKTEEVTSEEPKKLTFIDKIKNLFKKKNKNPDVSNENEVENKPEETKESTSEEQETK